MRLGRFESEYFPPVEGYGEGGVWNIKEGSSSQYVGKKINLITLKDQVRSMFFWNWVVFFLPFILCLFMSRLLVRTTLLRLV